MSHRNTIETKRIRDDGLSLGEQEFRYAGIEPYDTPIKSNMLDLSTPRRYVVINQLTTSGSWTVDVNEIGLVELPFDATVQDIQNALDSILEGCVVTKPYDLYGGDVEELGESSPYEYYIDMPTGDDVLAITNVDIEYGDGGNFEVSNKYVIGVTIFTPHGGELVHNVELLTPKKAWDAAGGFDVGLARAGHDSDKGLFSAAFGPADLSSTQRHIGGLWSIDYPISLLSSQDAEGLTGVIPFRFLKDSKWPLKCWYTNNGYTNGEKPDDGAGSGIVRVWVEKGV